MLFLFFRNMQLKKLKSEMKLSLKVFSRNINKNQSHKNNTKLFILLNKVYMHKDIMQEKVPFLISKIFKNVSFLISILL